MTTASTPKASDIVSVDRTREGWAVTAWTAEGDALDLGTFMGPVADALADKVVRLVQSYADPAPIPAHRCRIDTTTADPFYAGHPGYVVVCDVCGPLARPVAEPRDAHERSNRHEALNGYKR